jgi:hypothetical protein
MTSACVKLRRIYSEHISSGLPPIADTRRPRDACDVEIGCWAVIHATTKGAYVACSRGRQTCIVHTPDKVRLMEVLG